MHGSSTLPGEEQWAGCTLGRLGAALSPTWDSPSFCIRELGITNSPADASSSLFPWVMPTPTTEGLETSFYLISCTSTSWLEENSSRTAQVPVLLRLPMLPGHTHIPSLAACFPQPDPQSSSVTPIPPRAAAFDRAIWIEKGHGEFISWGLVPLKPVHHSSRGINQASFL